ncbi:MAG: hypothetical protein GKR89_30880 [Candidatus Latescibacteria bacterium]|nr:hypothetical protein [Candidatus Latescibacterota bacterium]
MSETTAPEQIVANFMAPADPNRPYIHWRNFLRQWWILGPFSFADRPYATQHPARALDDQFVADEALLVPCLDEEVEGAIWWRYSAVSVMNKWWELTPERVLLRHHHELRHKSAEPASEPPGGVHVTMDLFTVEDELMPCWGSSERGTPGQPYCPRCESPVPDRPDRCGQCRQRLGFYTSYSSWGFPRRAWDQPSFPFDYSVTYLAAQVQAPEAGPYRLLWSSNTPCRIWVNGRETARFDGPFLSCSANQNRKWDLFTDSVSLQSGWNRVVVKTVLSTVADGEHCFCARFEKTDGSRFFIHSTRGEKVAPERRLRVDVGAPIYIGVTDCTPSVMRCHEGTLLAGEFLSRDQGETWERAGDKHLGALGPHATGLNFAGGPDLLISSIGEPAGEGLANAPAHRSVDGWRTVEEIELSFQLGPHVPSMGEDGVVRVNTLNHQAVALPDGSVVGMCYGYCDHDIVHTDIRYKGWEKYPHDFGIYKYSSWCLGSLDGGRTWQYRGGVPPLPEMGDEGWAEPGLALLPNGDLLTILRNGEGNAPLYLARSSDGGYTWSDPVRSRLNGQYPGLLTLSNGLLVATYGRPDNRIAVCLDGLGEGWPYEITVSTAPGWQGVTAVEIGPNEILVVFEDQLWEPKRDDRQVVRHLVAHKVRLELLNS